MNATCPECGTEATEKVLRHCDACGFVRFGRLVLTSEETSKEINIGIDTTVTRDLIRSIAQDGGRFASPSQFRLVRNDGLKCWALVPEPSAKNPTCLNGVAVGIEPMALKDGDVISVGADHARLRVKLID